MNSTFVNSTSISSFADLCESSDNLPRVLVALVFTAFFLLTSLYLVGFGRRLTCSLCLFTINLILFYFQLQTAFESGNPPGNLTVNLDMRPVLFQSLRRPSALRRSYWRAKWDTLLSLMTGQTTSRCEECQSLLSDSGMVKFDITVCLLKLMLIVLGHVQVISPRSRPLTPIPEVSGY